MATTKDTLQSQDPLTMLANLIGGASQGVYQDPNTGARNFSALQGAGGVGQSLLSMKQAKLQEDAMRQDMDLRERQMKMAEEQHKQQKAAFAREQEITNIKLQQQHDAEAAQMMKSGYGKQITPGTRNFAKDPKTGKLVPTQTQAETEWGNQYEGKPLPTVDLVEKTSTKKPGLGGLAGPAGWLANSMQPEQQAEATLKVPIVPGSNRDGGIGKIDVRGIMDDDYMTRVGHAIATDPRFSDEDRSRLMAEWKVEKERTTMARFESNTNLKNAMNGLLANKQVDPQSYNATMQLFGDYGSRKNPEITNAMAKIAVAFGQGDLKGMKDAAQETFANMLTRMNPFTDTAFRMGIPSMMNPQVAPAQMVNYGKPVTSAAKASKDKFKK